ncbi:unnamed protein product [Lathyrus sativus]|nr:unnamed protein product [Lathyrus sativus]
MWFNTFATVLHFPELLAYVDPDFVEIPAQLLQNCFYEIFFLKLISGFHQDITNPLKDDLCKSIKRWRNFSLALKLKQDILYWLPVLEGTKPTSCFPFSVVGYEAACYSHIWSEVFVVDILASIFCNGVSNQLLDMQFRNNVLAPSGAKDSIELISYFLGRKSSIQAQRENLGSVEEIYIAIMEELSKRVHKESMLIFRIERHQQ